MKVDLPYLEDYYQDPEYQAASPEEKLDFHVGYFGTLRENAENEDDYNRILKEQADYDLRVAKEEFAVKYPEEKTIDINNLEDEDIKFKLNKAAQGYNEVNFNINEKVSDVRSKDMEDPNRSFKFKPFRYDGQTGYTVQYPNGEMETIPNIEDTSKLTEYLKAHKQDKFEGKREGWFDQAVEAGKKAGQIKPGIGFSELDGIVDDIRQVDRGLQGWANAFLQTWQGQKKGMTVGDILSLKDELSNAEQTEVRLAQQEARAASTDTGSTTPSGMYEEELPSTMGITASSPGMPERIQKRKDAINAQILESNKQLLSQIEESKKQRGSQVLDDLSRAMKAKGSEGKTWKGFGSYFADNPEEFMPWLAVSAMSGLPDAIAGTAAGVAGSVVGGPAGAAVAGGSYGAYREYTATLLTEMETKAAESGQNLNADLVNQYVQDEQFMAATKQKATTRAASIGVAEGILGKAGDWITHSVKGAVKRAVLGASFGVGEEMGGETAAQYFTEGTLDIPEIAAEGAGGTAFGATFAAVGAVRDLKKEKNVQAAALQAEAAVEAEKLKAKAKLDSLRGRMKTADDVEGKSYAPPAGWSLPTQTNPTPTTEAPFEGEVEQGLQGKEQTPLTGKEQPALSGQVSPAFKGKTEQAFEGETENTELAVAPADTTKVAPIVQAAVKAVKEGSDTNDNIGVPDEVSVDESKTEATPLTETTEEEVTEEASSKTKPNVSVTNVDSIIDQGGGIAEVEHDGKKVDFDKFSVIIDGDTAEVAYVELKPEYKGKGIGMAAYIDLGNKLAARGIKLRSSKAQHAQGRALWTKLAQQGLAVPVGRGIFEFRPDADTPTTEEATDTTPELTEETPSDPIEEASQPDPNDTEAADITETFEAPATPEKASSLAAKVINKIANRFGWKTGPKTEEDAKIKQAGELFSNNLFVKGLFDILSDRGSFDRIMREVLNSGYNPEAVGKLMNTMGLNASDTDRRIITNVLGDYWSQTLDHPERLRGAAANGAVVAQAIQDMYNQFYGTLNYYTASEAELDSITSEDMLLMFAPDSMYVNENGDTVPVQSETYTTYDNEGNFYRKFDVDESVARFNAALKAHPVRNVAYDPALDNKLTEAQALNQAGMNPRSIKDTMGDLTPKEMANKLKQDYPHGFVTKDSDGSSGKNVKFWSSDAPTEAISSYLEVSQRTGLFDRLYSEALVLLPEKQQEENRGSGDFDEHRVHAYVDMDGNVHIFTNLTYNKQKTYVSQAERQTSDMIKKPGEAKFDPTDDTFFLVPTNPNHPDIVQMHAYAKKVLSAPHFRGAILGLDISMAYKDVAGMPVAGEQFRDQPHIFEANALSWGMSGFLGNPISMSEIISEMTGKPSVLAGLYEIAKLGMGKDKLTEIADRVAQGMPVEYQSYPEFTQAVAQAVATYNPYIQFGKWANALESMFLNFPSEFFKQLYTVVRNSFEKIAAPFFSKQMGKIQGMSTEDINRLFPAHHGTRFDILNSPEGKLSLDYNKKGEGTNAFGHGLYFAEKENTSKHYAKGAESYDGGSKDYNNPKHAAADRLDEANGDRKLAIKNAKQWLRNSKLDYKVAKDSLKSSYGTALEEIDMESLERAQRNINLNTAAIRHLENNTESKLEKQKGNLYQVEITAKDDEIIHWDEPYKNQPAKVLEAFKKIIGIDPSKTSDEFTGENAYRALTLKLGSEQDVSEWLAKNGVYGNKHFDGSSRYSDEGKKTYNYVLFDASKVEITHENGTPITAKERKDELAKMFPQSPSPTRMQIGMEATRNKATLIPSKGSNLKQYIQQLLQNTELTENERSILNYALKSGNKALLSNISVETTKGPMQFQLGQAKIVVNKAQATTQSAVHEVVHAITSDFINRNNNTLAKHNKIDSHDNKGMILTYFKSTSPVERTKLIRAGVSSNYLDSVKIYVDYLKSLGITEQTVEENGINFGGAGMSSYDFYDSQASKVIPYGALNLDEFFAEGLTDPAFQKVLMDLPSSSNRSRPILYTLLKIASRIVGIPFNKANMMFDLALSARGVVKDKKNKLTGKQQKVSQLEDVTHAVTDITAAETAIKESNGVIYKDGEVSPDIVKNANRSTLDEQKEVVARQMEEERIATRFNALKSEYPSVLGDFQFNGSNLSEARDKVIESIGEVPEDTDAQGKELTDKKKEAIKQLTENKILAIKYLDDLINHPGITGSQALQMAESIEYMMNKTDDPVNMDTRAINKYSQIAASFADAGYPVGFKYLTARSFNEKWTKEFDARGLTAADFDTPISDMRNSPLGGIAVASVGRMATTASEVSKMGKTDKGAQFLKDLMGVYRDNIDAKQLEEKSLLAEFYDTIQTRTPGISHISANRIGIVARLTQWNPAAAKSPLDQIADRQKQLQEGIDIAMRYGSPAEFDIASAAYAQVVGATDLSAFPTPQDSVRHLESQLTVDELAVLNKVRDIGQRMLPALQFVKAVTQNAILTTYENYVHDSSSAPTETVQQSKPSPFNQALDVLSERTGINPAGSFPNLDIRAIADHQIKASTYEKHTGVERYSLFSALKPQTPLSNMIDNPHRGNGSLRPITERMRNVLGAAHNAMTRPGPPTGEIFKFIEALTGAVMGTAVVGWNAFTRNAVSSTFTRFASVVPLGANAIKNVFTYDTNRAQINDFLKNTFPTQFDRMSQYDVIPAQKDRFSLVSKFKSSRELKEGVGNLLWKTLPGVPSSILNTYSNTILRTLGEWSNSKPERYNSFAIWTAHYIDALIKKGTIKNAEEFLTGMPVDRRAATDASDYVTRMMGYAPDRASKGQFWNGDSNLKKILSRAMFGYKQQATGLAIEFQIQAFRTIQHLMSGNLAASEKAGQLATIALANSMIFRLTANVLATQMLWGGLEQYLKGDDEEEKKRQIAQQIKEYQDTVEMSNIRRTGVDLVSMVVPAQTFGNLFEFLSDLTADKSNRIATMDQGSLIAEKKEDLKIERDAVAAEITKASRTRKLHEGFFSEDALADEDEYIAKLDARKKEIDKKINFHYFTQQPVKAKLESYGGYGMAAETAGKIINNFTRDDLGTEDRERLGAMIDEEFAMYDNVGGDGFISSMVHTSASLARLLSPKEWGKAEGRQVSDDFHLKSTLFNLGIDPKIILERTQTQMAGDALEERKASEKATKELHESWGVN